ncbi:unnamed protein product [Ectocarpus sp. 8 AP-2014]
MMMPPSSYQEVGLPLVDTGLSDNRGGGDSKNNGTAAAAAVPSTVTPRAGTTDAT